MAITSKTTDNAILRSSDAGAGYVDWSAIFAGATLAAAIAMALIAFGSTLGLSLTSFADRSNSTPGIGVVIGIGLWFLWMQVSASLGGGYIAGRLRRRINDAPRHEVEMRDGMHGLSVWAVGVLLGAIIAGLIAALGAISAATVSAGAASNPQSVNVNDYYVDRLLRSNVAAVPAEGETPSATAPPTRQEQTVTTETRAVFSRLLMSGRLTNTDADDRAYLIQEIAARTGMNEQQSTERLDATLAAMTTQADQARRLVVLMGFLTVVSLLIGAVAAWWAATKGGEHRDQAVDHSRFVTWR